MPRRTSEIIDFQGTVDSPTSEVLLAVEVTNDLLHGKVSSLLEETVLINQQTHLGHSLYLWDSEVTPEDVEW